MRQHIITKSLALAFDTRAMQEAVGNRNILFASEYFLFIECMWFYAPSLGLTHDNKKLQWKVIAAGPAQDVMTTIIHRSAHLELNHLKMARHPHARAEDYISHSRDVLSRPLRSLKLSGNPEHPSQWDIEVSFTLKNIDPNFAKFPDAVRHHEKSVREKLEMAGITEGRRITGLRPVDNLRDAAILFSGLNMMEENLSDAAKVAFKQIEEMA